MTTRFTALALVLGGAMIAAAACKTSTAPSKDVNLTGTFGLNAYVLNGTSVAVDPLDSAVFTFTSTTYTLAGTGTYATWTDNGTYVAKDTATVNGDLMGQYSSVSQSDGTNPSGTFSFSSDLDTLVVSYIASGSSRQVTFVRLSQAI